MKSYLKFVLALLSTPAGSLVISQMPAQARHTQENTSQIFDVFPTSCVILLYNMAKNTARIDQIGSDFAA